ncbi:MAG: hypothetical protein ABI699_00745 [Caldimonas sp.]
MTEADTCREFVTPKLVEAGWGVAESDLMAASVNMKVGAGTGGAFDMPLFPPTF